MFARGTYVLREALVRTVTMSRHLGGTEVGTLWSILLQWNPS